MKKILLIALVAFVALGSATSCRKDKETFTVNFNSQGGSAVTAQKVEDGQKAKKPSPDPTRENYTFDGWAQDAQGTQPWDFANYTVVKNITLYAQWNSVDDTKGELETAISMSTILKQADYTSASWAPFAAALAEAQSIMDDEGADAAEIKTALDNLVDAYGNLVPVSNGQSVKDGLAAAITAAEALPSYGYTQASWENFIEALDAAETVNDDANATKGEIDTALANLNAAMDALQEDNTDGNTGDPTNPVATDKTALNARIAYADGLDEADYTADSWTGLESALTAAQATASQSTATQAQVNASLSRLNNAIAGLDHVVINDPNSDPSADKSALEQFISDSDQLNEGDYTADSWAVFQQALANAETVDADDSATQQVVDSAYNSLQAAVNDLESNQETGVVSGLIDQLTSAVNALPSADLIANNPLLATVTMVPATLADNIRDTLMPLLDGVDNTVVDGLNTQLNGVLSALGLDNLI